VSLISGRIPRYGMCFTWKSDAPVDRYILLVLDAYQSSFDVRGRSGARSAASARSSSPATRGTSVDNASPQGQNFYFALLACAGATSFC